MSEVSLQSAIGFSREIREQVIKEAAAIAETEGRLLGEPAVGAAIAKRIRELKSKKS